MLTGSVRVLAGRVRRYRGVLAATAGAGVAVAGAIAGTALLLAGGLRGQPTQPPTAPAAAAEGLLPDASDPAVTVLQPTVSPAPVPSPAVAPHHSAAPSAPSASTPARSVTSPPALPAQTPAPTSQSPSAFSQPFATQSPSTPDGSPQ